MKFVHTMTLVFLGCSLSLSTLGCGSSGLEIGGSEQHAEQQFGRVAIIDLDQVAKSLGRDKEMANSIQQAQASLNQQLTTVQAEYQTQIEEKEKEYGEAPTEDQNLQLATLNQQAAVNLNAVRQKAQTMLTNHNRQVLGSFREQVKPLANQVADEKGLSIVITKNDAVVFVYKNAVDITDEVVNLMRAKGLASSPPSTPPTPAAAVNSRPAPPTQATRQPTDNTATR